MSVVILFSQGRILHLHPGRLDGPGDPHASLGSQVLPLRQLRHGNDHPLCCANFRRMDRVSLPLFVLWSFLFLYTRVLQDSMSSTFEDEGPIPWFRTEMAIYYIVYFVVFPFFFVNIFVALVIVTFNELGEAELTDNIDKNQASLVSAMAKRIIRLTETLSSEIVYNVRGDNKTARNLRPRNPSGCSLPHLAPGHLPALRELHHAAHHPQHHPPHVQGGFDIFLQSRLHYF